MASKLIASHADKRLMLIEHPRLRGAARPALTRLTAPTH
jgi:hypothetical protein